jgi:WD40 repeat protein
MAAAFRARDGNVEPVLDFQKLRVAFAPSTCATAVDPTGSCFLFGGKVFDFNTGAERVSLQRPSIVFQKITSFRQAGGWVDPDRVVQTASLRTEGEEEAEEKRIIVVSDAHTGDILAQAPAASVTCLAPSPDGKWIVEGGADKRFRLRDSGTLAVEREIRAHDSTVAAFAWHRSLPLLVSAEKGRVRIWNTQNWQLEEQLQIGIDDPVLDITEDGKQLIFTRQKGVDYFEPESFKK